MKIAWVNYAYGGDVDDADLFLERYRTVRGWAEGLRDAGAEVVVVQGFARDLRLDRDGVRYEFVGGRFAPMSRFRIPQRLHRIVEEVGADVVHVNGLHFVLQITALRRRVPDAALIVQHHAERPSRWPLLQRRGLRAADGFFFTGCGLARPWIERGLIRPEQPVFEIMEGSSTLALQDRDVARRATGMHGHPVVLWAGHLDANKDPLTVLAGLERLLGELPEARLYMAYGKDDLFGDVRARLASSPRLAAAVELLGSVPYARMEAVFNSADVFVQGSHREGSGFALADALACGVVPVVSDIPSFRFMTGNGRIGALWPPGDVDAFRQAVREVAARNFDQARRASRDHFDELLSWPAIGRRAVEAYRLARKGK